MTLTHEQILSLSGSDLDAAVAEYVMGGLPVNPEGVVPRRRTWAPSTYIGATWEAVEKLQTEGWALSLQQRGDGHGKWWAHFHRSYPATKGATGCTADDAPSAICRAALLVRLEEMK